MLKTLCLTIVLFLSIVANALALDAASIAGTWEVKGTGFIGMETVVEGGMRANFTASFYSPYLVMWVEKNVNGEDFKTLICEGRCSVVKNEMSCPCLDVVLNCEQDAYLLNLIDCWSYLNQVPIYIRMGR